MISTTLSYGPPNESVAGQIMTNKLCSLLAGPLSGNDIFAHLPVTIVAGQTACTTNNVLVGLLTRETVQVEHDR